MRMKNPPHPGGFVLRQRIEPLNLTITDAAAAFGVTRTMLSELVNGKRGISPGNGRAPVKNLWWKR
jgi:antitoxin HigA-1